ncbi:hypothetical protein BSKO_07031 [Bryopsis sp. KO-2023]|nr:hypothetical protein BSKO_07031 [Bryopsis sp. KO-2023]
MDKSAPHSPWAIILGSKCKGLRNEGNKFELDKSALKRFNNDVQTFFDCCPSDSVVDFSIPELQLDGVIEISKPVTVEGGGASIGCYISSRNEGAVVIRSDNVTLRGLSFEGCNLNSTAALITIENSKNVTVKDLHFSKNRNAAGAPCMSLLQSNVMAKNLTAVKNIGIFGGVMSIVNSSLMKIQGSAFHQNEAMEQGGALYLHDSDLDAIDVWFIENSALVDGGAIFAEVRF